jgi:hypothetical protein
VTMGVNWPSCSQRCAAKWSDAYVHPLDGPWRIRPRDGRREQPLTRMEGKPVSRVLARCEN